MALRYHGSNAEIKVGGETICSRNAWAISFSQEKLDVTGFCDTNLRKVLGKKDASGTLGGFFDPDDFDILWAAANGGVSVQLQITPSTLAATTYFEGLAFLSIDNVSGSTTSVVMADVSFVADGDWAAVLGGTSA